MILDTMAKRVAENLGLLSSDRITVLQSRVTLQGIRDKLNDLYREEVAPLIAAKFPADFMNHTYPRQTYTASSTVLASSTGSTLNSSTNIFTNSMEGFQIQNVTDSTFRTILTYTSPSQVTVSEAINDTWDGDTIAVLGNEFPFHGDPSDLKEIVTVRIKYLLTDIKYIERPLVDKREIGYVNISTFSTSDPVVYRDSTLINGKITPIIGFYPYPTSWKGTFEYDYVAKPPVMSPVDEPVLNVVGLSEVLINGATAWGYRVLKEWDSATVYERKYEGDPNSKTPSGKIGIIQNYRPRTRSNRYRLRSSDYEEGLKRRDF